MSISSKPSRNDADNLCIVLESNDFIWYDATDEGDDNGGDDGDDSSNWDVDNDEAECKGGDDNGETVFLSLFFCLVSVLSMLVTLIASTSDLKLLLLLLLLLLLS